MKFKWASPLVCIPSAYQICFTATAVCIFWSRHGICIDTYCNIAFVLMLGSSGLKYLYCSTSFSRLSNWRWSLSLRPGSVSLMWFVSCWLSCLCKYGVPHLYKHYIYNDFRIPSLLTHRMIAYTTIVETKILKAHTTSTTRLRWPIQSIFEAY